MSVPFVNFGSDESFYVFNWVRRHRDAQALVAKALDRVVKDETFEEGDDVSALARDELAAIVEEEVNELIGEETVYVWDFDDVDDDVKALTIPLLAMAAGRIHYGAVAEALLIDAGKWSPEASIPEKK